jgi:putative alpha-1,2-mannosidase
VSAAVDTWNNDVFSTISVNTNDAANKTDLALLYSSLYFSHLMPSNRTGENPLWVSAEPYYDDFYAICNSTLSFSLFSPY